MIVMNHFFRSLREWLQGMDDPRNQSYITYTQADLGYMAILKNICRQHSMREMEENSNEETCTGTLRILSGNRNLREMPHYDIQNCYLEKLSPECLSDLRKMMINSLVRGKQFSRGRLLGKY
ncbi:MAG: transposase family protein [Lachnospiraceae bacterium]|nr:transposase family protein [Lachnospiraceae bacterium]